MSDAKKLEYAKIAGKSLVEKLDPHDQLAVITFETDVNVLVPISDVTNKEHLIQ